MYAHFVRFFRVYFKAFVTPKQTAKSDVLRGPIAASIPSLVLCRPAISLQKSTKISVTESENYTKNGG